MICKIDLSSLPHLLAQEDKQSWAILEDFGDDLLWHVFRSSTTPLIDADRYYRQAIEQLIVLHQHSGQGYGRYKILNASTLLEECYDWQEWCLKKLYHCTGSAELNNCLERLIEVIATQPYVFIHRDFHSKNILKKQDGAIGIIDYQDAMPGPMTYDIASLLRDCYVDWPEENVTTWALYYKNLAEKHRLLTKDVSDQVFLRWFDWTSLQRHLKALLTFARKSLRDKNDAYLTFIPRTLGYLNTISSRYSELRPLTNVIQTLQRKSDD
ncbi:MAG: phosphotransferase [Gammaproteobacteria bacterium]|nr:phosphotransferase [Gammaproteobacteria bacterium]